jgi:hypothetical protein
MTTPDYRLELQCDVAGGADRILQAVENEVHRSFPYTWGLRSVRFGTKDGELIIRGELPTYYLRQKLLSIAQRAAGLRRVRDEIQVVDDSMAARATTSS